MKFTDYLTLCLSLAGVIAVILLVYGASKWLSGRISGGIPTKGIRVLDKLYLAQNKALLVVQVGKKFLLVSLADKQMSKLCDLEESDVAELLQRYECQRAASMRSLLPEKWFARKQEPFDAYLQKARGERNDKDEGTP